MATQPIDKSPAQHHQPHPFPLKLWNTITKLAGRYDYSHEVYDGLHGCLSCKACASQCPIHVDIPQLKSQFLHRYHSRYLRSPRDYLMGHIEWLTQWQSNWQSHWQSHWPAIATPITHNPLSLAVLHMAFRLAAPPKLSFPTVQTGLHQRQALPFEPEQLAKADPKTSVILVQDCFTHAYDASLVLATYDLLSQLGLQVYVSPPLITGKPLQVLGFLDEFSTVAQQTMEMLAPLQQWGIPLVGLEPSMVLTYRDEYAKLFPDRPLSIQLPQEFLIKQRNRIPQVNGSRPYQLLGHCSEKALALASQHQWQQVFEAAGLSLGLVETGCCGMAGLYGYEAEHQVTSKDIFQLSWAQHLPIDEQEHPYYLASGFSCRHQVERLAHWRPLHPLQALHQALA